MNLNPVGDIIGAVGKVADDLFTSDQERLQADLQSMAIGLDAAKVDAGLIQGQQGINEAEAKHASIFVAGWRPAIGWIGAVALAYQFVLYPLLTWLWAFSQGQGWIPKELVPPPVLDINTLLVLLTGILGISTTRTFEKVRGVGRGSLKE